MERTGRGGRNHVYGEKKKKKRMKTICENGGGCGEKWK